MADGGGRGDDDDSGQDAIDIFQEPQGYFKPKEPFTHTSFVLDDGRTVPLRLVGESPLWAHHLWNGAKVLSDHLQKHVPALVRDRTVLELGAGAGLPSLVCAMLGARHVVVTDYPDPELIENLQYNISNCPHLPSRQGNLTALGYLWGADVRPLLEPLSRPSSSSAQDTRRFDTLILADILYNHSEHRKLVSSIRSTLERSSDARALVCFTPYRPWLLDRDLSFFDLVKVSHLPSGSPNGDEDIKEPRLEESPEMLEAKKIFELVLPKAMFEKDRGDERLRRTVFGYEIFWADLRS